MPTTITLTYFILNSQSKRIINDDITNGSKDNRNKLMQLMINIIVGQKL